MKNCDDGFLQKVAECYLRGSLNFSLQPEDVESMNWDWQQKFLDTTVNSQLLRKYPLGCPFSKLFFKKLINCLENQEVHDDFYTNLCHAINGELRHNGFCYRHYVIDNNLSNIITIKETNKMVVDGTTGMRTWEAALMLADWALNHKDTFTNTKILELGSGVGFTGVTIAKLCNPKSIYLTDFHSGVLKTICDNIRINFPNIQAEENDDETVFSNKEQTIGTMILDWKAVEHLPSEMVPDIVIGSDIVYDPVIIQPLCDVLKIFFDRNKELKVYIASVLRNNDTFQAFLNCLVTTHFSYKILPLEESVFIEWDQSIERCLLQISCKS